MHRLACCQEELLRLAQLLNSATYWLGRAAQSLLFRHRYGTLASHPRIIKEQTPTPSTIRTQTELRIDRGGTGSAACEAACQDRSQDPSERGVLAPRLIHIG